MSSVQENWSNILEKIKEDNSLTNTSYNSWIVPLKVYDVIDNTIYIIFDSDEADDQIGIKFVNKKYRLHILSAINEVMKKDYEVEFITKQESGNLKNSKGKASYNNSNSNKNSNINYISDTINRKYTFDNFVVGQNNKYAQTAALAVADAPGEMYNPLYIYGGPGLGKTHLMHAIGNYINHANPSLKILYVTSETFLNDVVEGLTKQNTSKIKDKYRTVDVLMVDDIQVIIGKEQTQNEFFNTFNHLRDLNKQIIISSDKPPKELNNLDDRFKSRFTQGLMADIGTPDYETRVAILIRKLQEQNFHLEEEVLKYIAENIHSNVRDIEGALNALILYSKSMNEEITIDIAKDKLVDYISSNTVKEITPQLCIEVVAKHFNLSVDDLIMDTRRREISRPRHFAMYMCSKLTSCSQEVIGNFLGGKDHSSIIYGVKKIEKEYLMDPTVKATVDEISSKIKGNLS